MQVEPMKPKLKPPGTQRLKLRSDILLSTSAFKFNLRRYIKGAHERYRYGPPTNCSNYSYNTFKPSRLSVKCHT
jgi:hypothetical protein